MQISLVIIIVLQIGMMFLITRFRNEVRTAILATSACDDEVFNFDDDKDEDEDADYVNFDDEVLDDDGFFKLSTNESDTSVGSQEFWGKADKPVEVFIYGDDLYIKTMISVSELAELQSLLKELESLETQTTISIEGPEFCGLRTNKYQKLREEGVEEVLSLLGLEREEL